mmetsp:Transcript_1167/g.2264  ORF Transcript_1167/g.2264 Transcript_1167/m.2264 type:complete len:242 (+) Transcript_1167:250-975(+)
MKYTIRISYTIEIFQPYWPSFCCVYWNDWRVRNVASMVLQWRPCCWVEVPLRMCWTTTVNRRRERRNHQRRRRQQQQQQQQRQRRRLCRTLPRAMRVAIVVRVSHDLHPCTITMWILCLRFVLIRGQTWCANGPNNRNLCLTMMAKKEKKKRESLKCSCHIRMKRTIILQYMLRFVPPFSNVCASLPRQICKIWMWKIFVLLISTPKNDFYVTRMIVLIVGQSTAAIMIVATTWTWCLFIK